MRVRLNTNSHDDFARYNNPYELDYAMTGWGYIPFTNLMSPKQVYRANLGSCHDMTVFELDELRKEGYDAHAKFIMAVGPDGQGGETHSFVYFTADGMTYWFEQAWEDYSGVHAFNTDAELFEYVIKEFKDRNPNQIVYMGDFIPEEHQVGEDLQTLVDICMNSAVKYEAG